MSKVSKQLQQLNQQYANLKSSDESIFGFALIDDKGYPLIQNNIPKSTVLRNAMTICQGLFNKGDDVTVAIEGATKTLWLKRKEQNYLSAIIKNN